MTVTQSDYEFGDFRMELAKRRLLRGSDALPLTPKVFDTLVYLVQHKDRVCEKDELMRALWPDTTVEENNLNQSISTLRRVLGDQRGADQYIATVPGRGYRFVKDVREARGGAAPRTKAVAVLPFKPLRPVERDEALELGMAETLIARLSRASSTVVRPLSSVRRYTDVDQDAIVAGRALEVESVLDGSIQRQDNRIRVTARLIRVRDGISLWAQTFDEEFTDVFRVQDAISERVAAAMELTLSSEEKRGLTRRYTDNVEAYHLYLKGLYYLGKAVRPSIYKGIEFFQQAVDLDPVYALAYAGIAEAYRRLPITSDVPPKEAFPKAKAAALKALEIDDYLAEAHMSLGWTKFWFDWDWEDAERELQRAIELAPNNGLAHMSYCVLLGASGRFDEAIAEGNKAVELEPLSPIVNANLAWALHCAGRDEDALIRIGKTLEIDPNFWIAHLNRAKALVQRREYPEAIAALEKARQFSGGSHSETISLMGYAWAMAGDRAKAIGCLEELQSQSVRAYVPPHNIAVIYCGLGEKRELCEWLEKAYEERDVRLTLMKVEPKWRLAQSEACFQSILKRVGLA